MAKKKKATTATVSGPPSKKLHRKANAYARAQFAALGLFIQNFENIVATLRSDCRKIVSGGQLGIIYKDPKMLMSHWNICSLPFHHKGMTAQPLLDIWQALMFEQCRGMLILSTISEKGRAITDEIVSEIANEFRDLIGIRNRLIHATWAIGRGLPDDGDDLSRFYVEKFKVNKEGLQQREDLPRSFDELMRLAKQAESIWHKLGGLLQFFIYNPELIEEVFSKSGKKWRFDPAKFEAISKRRTTASGAR